MAVEKMTELDKKLQQMALLNWSQFVATIGEDAIKRAKVCMLRQEGNKLSYISAKLNLTMNQVRYSCDICNH